MGIKLDWQIEAERAYQRAGEDPVERSRRRQRRLRVLLFAVLVVGWVCTIGGLIWYRLYTVDEQLRQSLISTVQAEAATLRIGDLGSYMGMQRVAPGGDWYEQQSKMFSAYQTLKTEHALNLTGNVLDTAIDGSRGRALVEEVVDGVSYETVWYYWRYSGTDGGWRHVPTDFTWWGDAQSITGKTSTVNYDQLDTSFAATLADRVDKWWSQGCGYLGCAQTPKLTVEIVPDPNLQTPRWDDPNTLVIPSPLAVSVRTPSNGSIPPTMEDDLAARIATRLFDVATANLRPVPRTDAEWLRQMSIDWLAATFTGRGDANHIAFVQSLKDHYGTQGLVSVIRVLSPSSDISIVGSALNQPLESLALDWRPFFQWRLDVEKTALNQGDTDRFQALWDTANPQALEQMRLRMSHPTQATPQVQAVAIGPGPDGIPQASVQATTADSKGQVIVFRLVNGAWKRSA